MATQDLVTKKLDAKFREAEAELDVLKAKAEARKAKEDMDEISGLRAAKDRTKQKLVDIKKRAAEDREILRRDAEFSLQEFQAGLKRLGERLSAWDAADERRFNARLDEADAKLRVWESRAAEKHAERAMKRHDALATLKERIALARAAVAERRHAEHTEKAAEALRDAARAFDEAYAAAATVYEKKGG